MKAYHVQGPGGQNEPRSEDDGGEVGDGGRTGQVRCCIQDDDRCQLEVVKVMMVTDMHGIDPPKQNRQEEKDRTQG